MIQVEKLLKDLEDIYKEYQEYQEDNFENLIDLMVKRFRGTLKQTHIEGKILNTISSKYPQYIYRWENMGDDGRWLRIYNVEKEKEKELDIEIDNIFTSINIGYEFDILSNIVDKEVTKEHYSHLLEKQV